MIFPLCSAIAATQESPATWRSNPVPTMNAASPSTPTKERKKERQNKE